MLGSRAAEHAKQMKNKDRRRGRLNKKRKKDENRDDESSGESVHSSEGSDSNEAVFSRCLRRGRRQSDPRGPTPRRGRSFSRRRGSDGLLRIGSRTGGQAHQEERLATVCRELLHDVPEARARRSPDNTQRARDGDDGRSSRSYSERRRDG